MSLPPGLGGPLASAGAWPLSLSAVLCDLRPRFLPKGRAGRGYRSIARNGRVLLCSDRPPAELAGQTAAVRVQLWHRAVLPGDAPEPFGLLLAVRCHAAPPAFTARLGKSAAGELWLDVGGGVALGFHRLA
jgi:hypothetical protein